MAISETSEPEEEEAPPPSLAIAAIIVAAGFLGSRALGLLRSVIIAQRFGTSPELDAYWVAFRLPDLVFQLLAGATLASAFIPVFAGVRANHSEQQAWRLASSVLNIVFIATAAIAGVAFLLAPVLVPLLAPGLGEETGRQEELQGLAIDLTRTMLISPVLFAVSGMFMGILNARRKFLTPALAPMCYNLSIIAAALISSDVRFLAVGVVAGAALHLVVQLPELYGVGMVYRFVADWTDAAVRKVGTLMAPRALGLAASQLSFYFVAIYFASRLGEGAISAVSFAWLIVMTPLGVVGMAISTAAFPTLADQAARADDDLAPTLAQTLRLILFLSLPAGIGLSLLALPLVVVLLERGAFNPESTALTVQALQIYALALWAHGGIEILSRGFYVHGDTKTPVGTAVMSMLINLTLTALLVDRLEVRGLAIALSTASCVECSVLFLLLRRRLAFADRRLFEAILRMVVATAAMAGAVVATLYGFESAGFDVHRTRDAVVILFGGAGIGAGVYLLLSFVLGAPEPRFILSQLPVVKRFVPAPSEAAG